LERTVTALEALLTGTTMNEKTASPFVYILILNWNRWKDTIECLESIFRGDYPRYRVIVCDNGSSDESLANIAAWAEGRLDCAVPHYNPLRSLSFPPTPKPLAYVTYDKAQAERGGEDTGATAQLILIQTGENLGFSGGNNVGLRYALARDDFDYVWLLNNDTVIKPDSLSALVGKMQNNQRAGMCGSTLLYYDDPNKAQALCGATYNKWLGTLRLIGSFTQMPQKIDAVRIEKKLAFICGASMLVSKHFLRNIGLLGEEYFLYYEELDWALRSGNRYPLSYAEQSVVYHKEGATIGGSNRSIDNKSLVADFYGIRNRLIIARKFHPYTLPMVYMGLIVTALRRVARKQWNRIPMILKVALFPRKYAVIKEQLIKIT
jgi:GT2 family glycosyltransferase